MCADDIRRATPADLTRITEIYGHYVRTHTATFELDAPDLAEMARRFDALAATQHPYLVATVDDRVVGYAYAGPYRPRPAYRFTVEDSVYLDPSVHGRGLGRALLASLLDASRERGYRQMIAVVGDRANVPSIRLHERCGFQRVGVFEAVGYKFERWLDTVLLQRAL